MLICLGSGLKGRVRLRKECYRDDLKEAVFAMEGTEDFDILCINLVKYYLLPPTKKFKYSE
jgi:hypothetical protein